ncbi:MAG: type IX secretion system sortase PorU [Cyclobacteriaceae bacterium]
MKWSLSILLLLGLNSLFAQNSVLSTGQWFKVGITERGVYKIDAAFLSELGIDVSTLDSRTFKIYGNGGGGPLSQLNSDARPEDLIENAIYGAGTDDGTLGDSDYFLFYGDSPHTYEWDGQKWLFDRHLYCDTSYYFLTFGGAAGMRMVEVEQPTGQATTVQSFVDAAFYEEHRYNKLSSDGGGSGRQWYDDFFYRSNAPTITLSTPDAVDSAWLTARMLGVSDIKANFEFVWQGQQIGTLPFDRVSLGEGSTYELKGRNVSGTFPFKIQSDNQSIDIRLVGADNASEVQGAINQLVLNYRRALILNESILIFSNTLGLGNPMSELAIGGSPDIMWEVTDPLNPIMLKGANSSIMSPSDKVRNYVAVKGNNLSYPIGLGEIENQNLHSLNPKDGLIITARAFKEQADRLADFHRTYDELDVEVVTIDEVYNEFSSGRLDITSIRDAIRFYWNKSSTFRYVTLFGDCTFDPRNQGFFQTNHIPIYESRNSLDPVESYSSDDYYGFMERSEGIWPENNNGDHTLEIGIGRLPAQTVDEARDVVTKIIRYASSSRTLGPWKNKITYVVDDGDRNQHIVDAELLSRYMDRYQAQTALTKIYLDTDEQPREGSYNQKEHGNGRVTYEKIKSAVLEGTFMLDFLGHGNEESWAHEEIFNHQLQSSLSNSIKLPIFVTATCEFGRYDSGIGPSGAEKLLLNPNGGAIALLTTSRPVYANTNYYVNSAFHQYLFERDNGEYLRLGDITRLTKNASLSGPINRNFALLGDPMLRLAYPQMDVVVTEINNTIVTNQIDTLSALEHVTISGEIRDLEGELVDDFNGIVTTKLFDRKTQRQTLGDESTPYTYKVQENQLFAGEATVKNGIFDISFILPKNISYVFDKGKMTFYASNDQMDASGSFTDLVLGGSDNTLVEDVTSPEVSLYMNDTNFVSGDIVGSSSLFIARINDESGINTSGLGISQDIILTINDEDSYVINNYYTADVDTYTSGTIAFPLRDLSPGRNRATLIVWDVHNNPTTQEVEFIVSDQPEIRLSNLMNYPNPANGSTTISFEHDRIGEQLDVNVQLYSSRGSLIDEFMFEVDDSQQKVDYLDIDLPTTKYQPGMYFYRVNVTSTFDDITGSDVQRLIITN